MNNHRVKGLALVAVATALAIPPAALAQNDDGDALIEEIMVTATKREASIYEVPVALSAFQGDKLAQQGIVDIVDIGKFVPNLNITQFSAGHNSSSNPFIRGIGLQDHLITTDPGVSVYVDGVYLGRQVGQNWSLSNIERIEVLRGPQGTLYGRNSIGGAINIITKTPGEDPGARVGIEVGSRDRLNADFYGDAQLTDNVAVALTGGFKKRGGVGTFLNLPNAGVRVGEMQEVFGRLAFRFALSDDASLTIAADANDGEGGLRPYTTLIDELGAECRATAIDPSVCLAANGGPNGEVYDAGYRNSDLASDPYDNNTGQASQALVTNKASGIALTLDWDLNDNFASKIIASSRKSEYKSGLDDDSFVDDFLSFPEIGEADQMSIEWQLNGSFDSWDFVSGVYYFEEDGENNQDPTVFLSFPGTFYLQQDVKSQAMYANVGYNVSDKTRVSAGVRYTEDKKDAETNVGNGLYVDDIDFDDLSWEVAANHTFDNGLNVYGTIQNGYQSGQYPARPFCLFGDLDGPDGPDNDCFQPTDNITATNYEVGIKGQPWDGFQMSAAVFFTQYSDLPYQISTTSGGGFSTTNAIVDQDSTGFEWESTLFVTDNFLFHASLGYIDVSIDSTAGIPLPTAVAPLTPELTASLSPEVSFDTPGGGEFVIRVDWSYRDEMFGEPTNDPDVFTKIDSRDLINFDIAYHTADGSFTAAFYGRNAGDERYDNARLNTGDYVLRILSNDPSEFGLRFVKEF
ncbi:MAG: TonB-dependent receptor plug domain-containing protein [Woeseiaceae bacterium]|nr:TonB-dependent receptor plug domain-containing protein [Woeseiaceae bacterium]